MNGVYSAGVCELKWHLVKETALLKVPVFTQTKKEPAGASRLLFAKFETTRRAHIGLKRGWRAFIDCRKRLPLGKRISWITSLSLNPYLYIRNWRWLVLDFYVAASLVHLQKTNIRRFSLQISHC
ncbi:hypothetical protein Zmor_002615 [Zophobas morio]|uniref:Uncharacterized protein n=1 Tax=Zophobas morio TaxID=2755281 RepID=A0AA38J1G6_9CUCU|nr:hypothetical protein Zmor_002615 [Zophobas morio]